LHYNLKTNMPTSLNKRKLSLTVSAKKSEIFVSVPANPYATVVFLYENGKNTKNKKSELARQILNKSGIALISASYNVSNSMGETQSVLKEIIDWIDDSVLNHLPIGLFVVGDGYPSFFKFAKNNPEKIKASIITCISNPIDADSIKTNSPVMLISGSLDTEITEAAVALLKSDKNLFEHKEIKDSSRFFTELGKLGEALTVSFKWLKKMLIARAAA
jgi:hypothetical protein